MHLARKSQRKVLLVRPHRGGWQAFESPDSCPQFPDRQEALNYAVRRLAVRNMDIHVVDASGKVERVIRQEDAR